MLRDEGGNGGVAPARLPSSVYCHAEDGRMLVGGIGAEIERLRLVE